MWRPWIILLLALLALESVRAQSTTVVTLSGQGSQPSAFFTVNDKWEVQWQSPSLLAITVLSADGSVVAGASASVNGTLLLGQGGKYYLRISQPGATSDPWHVTVLQLGPADGVDAALTTWPAPVAANPAATSAPPTSTVAASTNAPPAAAPSGALASSADSSLTSFDANAATAPGPGVLTESQARAVVVVKGDVAEGTGFLVRGPHGPAVVTNLHVLSANPNVHICSTTGEQITTLGLMGASDRDLAMVLIQDNHYNYLDLASDVAATVQNGDPVITPGNSEGGEVVLNTKGTVLGVGPERVEFSNPIYHGNSGGPVFDLKTGKVIAVVTQALKVRNEDDLDKASFENKDSAITSTMRYFGYRLDTVPTWQKFDWNQFLSETTFIDNFHDLSRCLDSLMNGSQYEKAHVASTDEYGPPNALYYMKNPKLVEIHDNFHRLASDAGDSQRLDAGRELVIDLEGLAATDQTTIQNPANFYAFDQIRAQQEIKYRHALEQEIESLGDKISDMGH